MLLSLSEHVVFFLIEPLHAMPSVQDYNKSRVEEEGIFILSFYTQLNKVCLRKVLQETSEEYV